MTATESESAPDSKLATDAKPAARRGLRALLPGGPQPGKIRRGRAATVLTIAAVLLVVLAVIAACLGQVSISPPEVIGSVLHRIGLGWGPLPSHANGDAALWEVRFPRVVLAMLVGASLGCAGAVLQGVFANPLAEPGVIGVSAGAAVGASAVILIGGVFSSSWLIAAAAFAGGLGTTLLVYMLARADGRTEVVTVILTGVAVNAFGGGLIAYFTFVASPAAREQIVFWQLGTLGGATWDSVLVVTPLAVVGIAGAAMLSRRLDLLALGEGPARHLGVDVERVRRWAVVLVGVLVAGGVAFTGIIAFVGLVVPHAFRMLVGPSHRFLIPASTVGGAVVLLAADIGARTLVDNADLPLGMLTSLVGGPFFFWLLYRTRRAQGGWS